MVYEVALSAEQYGSDGYSHDALEWRTRNDVAKQRNIATFHFIPRPGVVPVAPNPTRTLASTGIGVYTTVGVYVEHQVRINASHSEQQFIDGFLKQLISEEVYPAQYVVDWVYTERPACPDVYWSHKRVASGCRTGIEQMENLQRQRKWDPGQPHPYPYELRDDLKITVYSSFDSAAEIGQTVIFGPIRREVYIDLYYKLVTLYHSEYAAQPGDDYDTNLYDNLIPAHAREVAERLPSWTDYHLTLRDRALFRRELAQEADTILKEEKATVQARLRK